MFKLRGYIRKLESRIPVSYTHLDVYKRQVHAFPDEALSNRGDGIRNIQMASYRGIVIILEDHGYKLALQPYLWNPSSTFLATEDVLGQKIMSITLA